MEEEVKKAKTKRNSISSELWYIKKRFQNNELDEIKAAHQLDRAKRLCTEYQELTEMLVNKHKCNLKPSAEYLEVKYWESFEKNEMQNCIKPKEEYNESSKWTALVDKKETQVNIPAPMTIDYLIKTTIETSIANALKDIPIRECPTVQPNDDKKESVINIAWSGDDESTKKVAELLVNYMKGLDWWNFAGLETTSMMGNNEYISKFESICTKQEFDTIWRTLYFLISITPGASDLSVDVYGKQKI